MENQKQKVETKEKEAFSAQYKLVSVEEELETLRQQAKAIEEERAALRTSLMEEEVARIAAEGRIPLPASTTLDEFSSPKKSKSKMSRLSEFGIFDPSIMEPEGKDSEIALLQKELSMERRFRRDAEDLVDFMKIECQLQRCSCRLAEKKGTRYIHDSQLDTILGRAVGQITTVEPARPMTPIVQGTEVKELYKTTPVNRDIKVEEPGSFGPLIEFSPIKGSFDAAAPDSNQPNQNNLLDPPTTPPSMPALNGTLAPVSRSTSPSLFSLSEAPNDPTEPFPPFEPAPETSRPLPPTPQHSHSSMNTSHILSRTITTTIPLADPETPSTQYPCSPGMTKTREEALASIQKWRKGRSRSVVVHGTPRKGLATPMKRDCSAPVAKLERKGRIASKSED